MPGPTSAAAIDVAAARRKYQNLPAELIVQSDCVIPIGHKPDSIGYVRLRLDNGQRVFAHRMAWVAYMGRDLDPGMTIDHLCANRACVNPAHLEQVPQGVNVLRGTAPAAVNARKTHCIRGHEFTRSNTYLRTLPNGNIGRQCRECGRIRARKSGV